MAIDVLHTPSFAPAFQRLTGHSPMRWQRRLFEVLRSGWIPDAVDLPTGLGKTSVMAIWLLARAFREPASALPRRLIYVVDRRVVVDQATAEAERIAAVLRQESDEVISDIRRRLSLAPQRPLPISTLRGGLADNREWTYDAAGPAIVIGTIDLIGSRLLFSGYRMSRWSRSMQAGLIGIDSLIVLDEAHLSPAFCKAVPQALSLQTEMARAKVPVARFLPLSATLGEANAERVFRLEEADSSDPVVTRRIGQSNPTKRLVLTELGTKGGLVEALARDALKRDGGVHTVLIYCNMRKDAKATADALRKMLGGHRKGDVGLITGALRGNERDLFASSETCRAFGYENGKRLVPDDQRTRFLVCTSAGEVGADLDAEAAVMDLVPLERMIQRLGRVNRRGECTVAAPVDIYYEPAGLSPDRSDKDEHRKAAAERLSMTKVALESLPNLDAGGFDGSPCALSAIDPQLRQRGSTPPPELVSIEREHVEAWALTSLELHAGSPEVEPFLRGVAEEEQRLTTVAWRADVGLLWNLPDASVERAMAVARLQPLEVLEAPSAEVADILVKRAKSLREKWGKGHVEDHQTNGEPSRNDTKPSARMFQFKSGRLIGRGEITLRTARLDVGHVRSIDLGGDPKAIARALADTTIVLDPVVGGLDDAGALTDCDGGPELHVHPEILIRCVWPDGRESELLGAPQRLVQEHGKEALRDVDSMRPRLLRRAWSANLPGASEDEDGPILEYWKQHWDLDGETASAARLQSLREHHCWARTEMECLAKRLDLPTPLANALTRSIALHDLGKDRPGWQNGVGAPKDGRPYAKSDQQGPGVGSYRHEFGSLRDVLYKEPVSLEPLDRDLRDLALHLIGAHHGRARPVIPAEDEEEIFEEVLAQDALEAALRYVRMQRYWGPWGLAWLEALFRSVDATVSRRLEQEEGSTSSPDSDAPA